VSKAFETTIDGVFAAGNVVSVHGLVDDVSKEAVKAGKAAAEHILASRG
jgi:thioredoxin reductase